MDKSIRIHFIDHGFCRINYIAISPAKVKMYYCLQEEAYGVVCYRCSKDFEPDYPTTCPEELFEIPTGDSLIERTIRTYLTGD